MANYRPALSSHPHMNEVLYIVLGWLFGLLSPRIIDSIKAHYDRRNLAAAIRSEAEDLQYRAAATSFLLVQRFGEVTDEYLTWISPKLHAYAGNEPIEAVRRFVASLLEAPAEQRLALATRMRAQAGEGVSLKNFSASLIDSSLPSLAEFPVDYQKRVHEFRSQLAVLNQEIDRAKESLKMTFDSSMSNENHDRLVSDLNSKYRFIEGTCRNVCNKLQALIEYDVSKI
jgi:DnaJ-domain-containing protein 1